MHLKRRWQRTLRRGALIFLFVAISSSGAWAQSSTQPASASPAPLRLSSDPPAPPPATADQQQTVIVGVQSASDKGSLEIYGFGQADAISDFKQNDPNWYDVVRPSKLPAFENQFGENGRFYLSARQSRLGAKGELPTANGPVFAQFEFDMFGVGRDAGLTTIRLRHAYGQWKQIGAGQTNSQFMDIDVFPNIIDYWGPNGMLFFRNVQLYYRLRDDQKIRATIAIENPGASGDGGVYSDRVELQNVKPRFPMPDLTGNVRLKGKSSHFQFSGILRRINYDDVLKDQFELSGHVTGWGTSFSGTYNLSSKDVFRGQYVYGEGIANYFNDAPIDVAIKNNPGNAVTPIVGEALPVQGLVLFVDHTWNDKFTSSGGYSRVDFTNSDAQAPNAYKDGQYIVANLLATPAKNVMMGAEFQWAHRENNSDGFKSDDFRVQVSFKYSFSYKVGG
jgi:hypothetical protein